MILLILSKLLPRRLDLNAADRFHSVDSRMSADSNPTGLFAPGFYRTNTRALTLRELVRWFGWWRLPLTYAVTRLKKFPGGVWMPELWADTECGREELSDRLWEFTASHRAAFERLGFAITGFNRIKRQLNLHMNSRDGGGIQWLHANRSYVGLILYSRHRMPEPVNQAREKVIIAFTAVFPGGTFACTNNRLGFDPLPGQEVLRLKRDDPVFLFEHFLRAVERRGEVPVSFPDAGALRRWHDGQEMKHFESRVKRRLFVRMSDEEVRRAQRSFPPPLPADQTKPPG